MRFEFKIENPLALNGFVKGIQWVSCHVLTGRDVPECVSIITVLSDLYKIPFEVYVDS